MGDKWDMDNNVMDNVGIIDGINIVGEVDLRQNRHDRLDHIKKRAFLEDFAQNGNITSAAKYSGVARTTHYWWLENDLEYAELFKEAENVAVELLELEARRRAYHGVEEPVFQKGELVGHIQRYSDTLTIFLLKAHNPGKYRDNVQVNVSGDVTLKTSSMTDQEKLDLVKMVAAKALKDAAVTTTYSEIPFDDTNGNSDEPETP